MAKVQMDLLDAAQNLTFSNFSRLQDKSVGISQLPISVVLYLFLYLLTPTTNRIFRS